MFVKICGITCPADAVAAVDAGADAIGLNFVPTSRRFVDVEAARLILAVVPDEVMTVGIFWDHPVGEILKILEALHLDAAQLHGNAPQAVTAVAAVVQSIIKVVKVDGATIDPIDDDAADIVMLDGPAPGSGVPFDWNVVGELVATHKVLLAGGLRPGNVAEAVRQVRPWGVDVASGVEAEPRRKDPEAIRRFVIEARAAARRAP